MFRMLLKAPLWWEPSFASSGLLSEVGLLVVSWPPCWGWKIKWWEISKRGWVFSTEMYVRKNGAIFY